MGASTTQHLSGEDWIKVVITPQNGVFNNLQTLNKSAKVVVITPQNGVFNNQNKLSFYQREVVITPQNGVFNNT